MWGVYECGVCVSGWGCELGVCESGADVSITERPERRQFCEQWENFGICACGPGQVAEKGQVAGGWSLGSGE